MRKLYILKLAVKNILAHKLRSILTVSGVAIGVGFIVFLVSLGYGLQRISTNQIANIQALQIIDVTPGKSKIIKIDDTTVDKFKKISNVVSAEPDVNVVGNIIYKTSTTEGVIYGKDLEYLKLEDPELLSGKFYQNNLTNETVVNQTFLKRIGITDYNGAIGKKVKLKILIGPEYFLEKTVEPVIKEEEFQITGVLRNESSPYAYIPLEKFKSYKINYYNSVKVQLNDKKYTDQVKKELESLGFTSTSLKDTVDQINQFFTIFQLILFLFGAIAVMVAVIGMFNTLTISLLEKTREISFMKILGTTSKDIWQLFLFESLLIGIFGTIIGVTAGTSIGILLNNILINLAEKTGNKPVMIFYTPITFIIYTFLLSIFLSFLTGIYPSFRASKIDALEAMRYE